MDEARIQMSFFLLILVGTLVLTFFIFLPFFNALILAAVFAIIFQPLFRYLERTLRAGRGVAAALTVLIVLAVIITPLFFFSRQVFIESRDVYESLRAGTDASFWDSLQIRLEEVAGRSFGESFRIDSRQYTQQAVSWFIQHGSTIFVRIGQTILSLLIGLIAFYYLLKDGHRLRAFVISMSPLADIHDEEIFGRLYKAVNSVIRGTLLIALIQGTLTGFGLALFGVPHPALWGMVATFAALIPGIGTSLVLAPAIGYLFLFGSLGNAIGLLIWGVLAVGLIDNFLGPALIGTQLRVHNLLVLLSVLGGISVFGPIGFLTGPLVLALLFALFDIYRVLFKQKIEPHLHETH